jgi:hypothetical protein
MDTLIRVTLGAVSLSVALVAGAQQPIIYPAKGQSPQQQQRDEGECHGSCTPL